ncbi:MAG TPA: hypothetical protein VF042_15220 [Gemmatimonadaceae bacterium]
MWRNPLQLTGTFVAAVRAITLETEEAVAEIRIEEKKRGAPWILILLLIVVAAIIGWWLWSSRESGTSTTTTPSGAVADTATKTP